MEAKRKQKEAEKERKRFNGKLVFKIEFFDHSQSDIEKNDSGQIIWVDTQVGCNYNLTVSNYLKTQFALVNLNWDQRT